MSESDVRDVYIETTTTPSMSTSRIGAQTNSLTNNKKRKTLDPPTSTNKISNKSVSRFCVLRKLNIQLTRTEHHIGYLEKCISNKSIPRSLRVNLTPQVPVITSILQIKWEEAIINFGTNLTEILLEYWQNLKENLQQEISSIFVDLQKRTSVDEIDLIKDIISKINLSVEKELSNKVKPTTQPPQPGVAPQNI